MDNNSQNTPQPQDNLSEPVPIMPPEPLQPQPQSTESISPAFQPTEPVPTMPVEPVQSQTQPQSVRQSPEKSAKKSNKILAIIVILVIMLISGVVSAYFIIQPKAEESMVASNPTLAEDKKTNDNSVSGENTSTADATSVLKPEDVTDKIKSHFAKTFTFFENNEQLKSGEMQVTIRSESPLYKTEGNDFYMNYDGGSSITLTAGPIYTREDSTTRKEDIDIRTEIAKIYNDFGLAKTDARGLMKETDIYTGKGLICSVQSPSVNIDITPRTYANCGIVSAYEDFAPTIKEFSKIIPNNTDAPFFSNPKISSSPVSGYQKATVSVGGVNSLGGAAALLYKKDSKPWVYFTSTQGIIPCSAYNTSDLISAFNGDRCYDANDTEATVK